MKIIRNEKNTKLIGKKKQLSKKIYINSIELLIKFSEVKKK